MTTRTTEPTRITQGERIAWTRTLTDYSADLYTLVYRFRSDVGPGFNVTATADGAAHAAVITAAVSGAAKKGQYTWQAWITEIAATTNTFIIGSGWAVVKQGFTSASTAAVDTRSEARIALDAINAAISGKATADMLDYSISTPAGTTTVKRMSMKDLLDARELFSKRVAKEVADERARETGKFSRRVLARLHDA